MSVTVALPVVAVSSRGYPSTEASYMEDSCSLRKRRSGLLNVWTVPSLEEAVVDSTMVSAEIGDDRDDLDSGNGSRKPSLISCSGEVGAQEMVKPQETSEPPWSEGEVERTIEMVGVMDSYISSYCDEDQRKTSDPFASQRRENLRRTEPRKQRCLSDTQTYMLQVLDDGGDCGSSAMGGDSGIDECPKVLTEFEPFPTSEMTPTSLQVDPPVNHPIRQRRLTPAPIPNLSLLVRSASVDQSLFQTPSLPEDEKVQPQHRLSSHSTGSNHSSKKRSRLTKHLSIGSLGGSSDTCSLQSFCDHWDCQSNQTMVTDLLSNLGFEDFDNPQLIPDRFIPQDKVDAKPSYMMEQVLLGYDVQQVPSSPESPLSNVSGQLSPSFPMFSDPTVPSPQTVAIPTQALSTSGRGCHEQDLPLGATAENFLPARSARSGSPPPGSAQPFRAQIPQRYAGAAIDPTINTYTRMNAALDLIPEETASDLSPSPRWLSPRVSLDHSYLDLAVNQLGASLSISNRKRSLPNREGYRVSVESMISEQDSIYFSVTSYDDELAKEKEKEREDVVPPLPVDDSSCRRRRKGVYTPPPELLSWLQVENRIEEEEDPDDQPWPFNEQAKLRKSLTELHLKQQRNSLTDSGVCDDRSPSPFPENPPRMPPVLRRFSANAKPYLMYNHLAAISKPRRVSLPSSCRFHTFEKEDPATPPSHEPSISPIPSLSEESSSQHSTHLPPGMTRSQALGYKRECLQLRVEVEASQEKLKSLEHLRRIEVGDFKHTLAETEESFRGELWLKERRSKDLEEIAEAHKRELRLLQQEQQVSIARAKEDVREAKNREISEIWAKSNQMVTELKEKMSKLEEECRHLRLKEKHLMQKAHQQSLRNENESLHREVAQLKEQLRREKEAAADLAKEKASEIKQIRIKAAMEREEALKSLRSQLQKSHEAELSAVKQAVQDFNAVPSGPVPKARQSPLVHSPVKAEMRKLKLHLEQTNEELAEHEERVQELESQLKQMHKERLLLEQRLTKL